MSTQSDMVGLGAIAVLGAILYKKISGVGGDMFSSVNSTVTEKYETFKTDVVEKYNYVTDIRNYSSYTSNSVVLAGDRALEDAPTSTKKFVADNTYGVGGYRDVSKIGVPAEPGRYGYFNSIRINPGEAERVQNEYGIVNKSGGGSYSSKPKSASDWDKPNYAQRPEHLY